MNKETTGILRDDITIKEWHTFYDAGGSYLGKVVEGVGKRFVVGHLHLPESFYKSVTTAYPADTLTTMSTAGEIGLSDGKAAVLVAFDKSKASPFNVRWLSTGAAAWVKDFNPKGVSEKGLEGG